MKKILHIQTVKQRHSKQINMKQKNINLYFLLLGGFCPRGAFVLDP